MIRIFSSSALVCALLACPGPAATAQDAARPAEPAAGETAGPYHEPLLEPSVFDLENLGMIEAERREYAVNLASCALDVAAEGGLDATGKPLSWRPAQAMLTRKLIGLAFHLSPRQREAIVANGRLKLGVIGTNQPGRAMTRKAFATLLAGRAEELKRSGGDDNVRLAGCFLDVAAGLDPASDEVIFAFENHKMDGYKIDWTGILGSE